MLCWFIPHLSYCNQRLLFLLVWNGLFSRSLPCEKLLSYSNLVCTAPCHSGPCWDCGNQWAMKHLLLISLVVGRKLWKALVQCESTPQLDVSADWNALANGLFQNEVLISASKLLIFFIHETNWIHGPWLGLCIGCRTEPNLIYVGYRNINDGNTISNFQATLKLQIRT